MFIDLKFFDDRCRVRLEKIVEDCTRQQRTMALGPAEPKLQNQGTHNLFDRTIKFGFVLQLLWH